MLNYKGQFGAALIDHLKKIDVDFSVEHSVDGRVSYTSSDEVLAQSIIDAFDPLLHERAQQIARVQLAEEAVHAKYITPASGKIKEYQDKESEALAYISNSSEIGPFLAAESQETGESPVTIASTWQARAQALQSVHAVCSAIIGAAKKSINAAALGECQALADAAIARLELL